LDVFPVLHLIEAVIDAAKPEKGFAYLTPAS
jgi:hypothetical protein